MTDRTGDSTTAGGHVSCGGVQSSRSRPYVQAVNRHEFVDVASISISAALSRNQRLFAHGLDSEPVGRAIEASRASLDELRTVDAHDVTVETFTGALEAGYLVRRWYGFDTPTVIYHHGSGEDPFDFGRFSSNSGARLFGVSAASFPVNLIVVRAPFHGRSSREYLRSMGSLSNFVGMVAASTTLVESLVRHLQTQGAADVVVSGLSLGGFVANLHRAFFDSATRYVPMLAGVALDELFVSSVYRKLVADVARSQPETLRAALNFEDAFAAVETANCAPVLARYDRLVELETQRPGYAGIPVTVFEKGHVTGALATETLRGQLDRALTEPS